MIKCTILGCGGSMGVPQIGCQCSVCSSNAPKNSRLRSSILIESENTKILVDATPDLRQCALKYNISKLDAVIITHAHSDHFSGIDDLKPIYHNGGCEPIKTFLTQETYDRIGFSYDYIFNNVGSPIYKPILDKNIIQEFDVLQIGDITIQLFPQIHGENMTSLGLRIEDFAYSTDVNEFPDKSYDVLKGVQTWIVDCLRYHYAPTHATFEQTLKWIEEISPKQAYLTHMAHEIDFNEISKILPSGVAPLYDGKIIQIKY